MVMVHTTITIHLHCSFFFLHFLIWRVSHSFSSELEPMRSGHVKTRALSSRVICYNWSLWLVGLHCKFQLIWGPLEAGYYWAEPISQQLISYNVGYPHTKPQITRQLVGPKWGPTYLSNFHSHLNFHFSFLNYLKYYHEEFLFVDTRNLHDDECWSQ